MIVNFNGKHLLAECFDSLKEQTLNGFEVILVDNASSDGSVEYVRAHYPEIRIVETGRNLGYGGGNNAGIAVARGQYIFLLNNDTKVDPRCLSALFHSAEQNGDAGMWACRIMNYYERSVIDNTGLLMYRDGIARGRGRLETYHGQYDDTAEVFFPSGCAGLYRKSMLDRIGAFDEDLFLYLDDVDIGLRARWAGWRCLYVPEAVVYHKYSATTEPYSPLKAYLVERNRIWVVFKYFPLSMIVGSFWYAIMRYLVQAYGMLTGRGAGSRLVTEQSFLSGVKTLVKAYWDGFKNLGTVLRKRKEIMGMMSISRREVSGLFDLYGIGVAEVALKD